jgi:hypothetical protein
MRITLFLIVFVWAFISPACTGAGEPSGEGEGDTEAGEGEGDTGAVVLCDAVDNFDTCVIFDRPECPAAPPTLQSACVYERLACLYCVASAKTTPTEPYTCDLNRWVRSDQACLPP